MTTGKEMRSGLFLLTAAFAAAPLAAQNTVVEVSIVQLDARLASGKATSQSLTRAYLARVAAMDRKGPALHAVIALNPDALAMARASDARRRAGHPLGPLDGIPVLIKDNIETKDPIATTAGSLALKDNVTGRDAPVVARLRAAGAVILGKTNLSEWANIRSMRSTSGWSARGGLTRNPYALDRNTSGSSAGAAVAMAADLCAVAIGTETDGSIVSPASLNGVVGLKPTVGLVSRDGIVPISRTQDTAGPITRTVADAACLLAALAGVDTRDSATAASRAADYIGALDPRRLAGARLGVARNLFVAHDEVRVLIERSLVMLKVQGAVIVDPVELPQSDALLQAELEVLLTEFKHGLADYLAQFAPGAPVRTLADLIAWNRRHRERELRWFGQDLFEQAEAKGGLDSPAYLEALATCRRLARTEGLDAVLREHRLDALVAPTAGPAWVTDPVNGDHFGGGFSSPAAIAGYPHLTVPAGFVRGLPVGLSFVGPAWSEALLLGLGHAFEQATRARRAPTFPATLPL